ncbi:MAG: cation diffusion facilitator family transporter [Acidobacteriaceae bacterium]
MQTHEDGPLYGGIVLGTKLGFMEVSIFEMGVPPQFRIHFYDFQKRPVAPPQPLAVTIETVRPDGTRQIFAFEEAGSFLRSTSDIPEPHEFTLHITLSTQVGDERLEAAFTEEGHSHDGTGGHEHGHNHAHGEGHSHETGKGLLAWFRGNIAHSHAASDKVDETLEANDRGIAALKLSLIGLLITAALQLAVVVVSGSVALFADMIHNFGDATTSIPLWIAFSLAKRGANRRFTYGYGKVEDLAGAVIVGVIFASACVAAYESIMKILHPHPMDHLWWVAVAAVIGFAGNEIVAQFRIKTGKAIGSAALVADGAHARVDGFTSLAVLIGVVATAFGYPLVDPIVGLLITIAILFIVKDATVSVFNRTVERIEPSVIEAVEHAPLHVPGVLRVESARARWLGHRVYADVQVIVDAGTSLRDTQAVADAVTQSLKTHVPSFGEALVLVKPGI